MLVAEAVDTLGCEDVVVSATVVIGSSGAVAWARRIDAGARGVALTTLLTGPQPIALRAATRNEYVAPFVIPVDV